MLRLNSCQFVVCCLLFVVCCLLFVVWLFVVSTTVVCSINTHSVVCWQVVCCLLFVVTTFVVCCYSCLLFVAYVRLLFVVCKNVVCCLLFVVCCNVLICCLLRLL